MTTGAAPTRKRLSKNRGPLTFFTPMNSDAVADARPTRITRITSRLSARLRKRRARRATRLMIGRVCAEVEPAFEHNLCTGTCQGARSDVLCS